MILWSQIFKGGAPKDPEATIEVPHYDSGGNVAPLNSIPRSGTNQMVAAMPAQQNPQGAVNPNSNQFVAHPGQKPGDVWGNAVPLGDSVGAPFKSFYGALGEAGAGATHMVGDTFQGIGSAFTAQNQYNAQLAPTQQSDYSGVINQGANNALSGYDQYVANQAQQQNVANQLQNTGGQYQNIASGLGPNPAQMALNQSTGQNVANQAALMAGQRGASANTGLIARQAAHQGANTQQQAAGQAATLQANQQLAGLQGLQGNQVAQANIYGQMGNQVQGEQNVNAGLFSSAGQLQNTQNANNIANYGMAQGINSQVAQNNANAVNKTTSGLMGGASSLLGMAEGGKVDSKKPKLFAQDDSEPAAAIHTQYAPDLSPQNGPKSFVGNYFKNNAQSQPLTHQTPKFANGGRVPAMVSPGEKYLNPKEVAILKEGKAPISSLGKMIPGKAKVKGDSYDNDTVPATLQEGGVVIPRSKMNTKDADKQAAFVRAHSTKRGLRG